MVTYYDELAPGYDELHGEEQIKKLQLILSELGDSVPVKGKKLLDVGCGSGISTSVWKCDCVGVDPSEKLIELAKSKYPDKEFKVANAEYLPFSDGEFDFVVSVTAVQNFSDIKKGLEEIRRVGKDSAIFVISALRKSSKIEEIERRIIMKFRINKIIMEEKDVIFFCGKNPVRENISVS